METGWLLQEMMMMMMAKTSVVAVQEVKNDQLLDMF